MQKSQQDVEAMKESFLDRKFRYSKSFNTRRTYEGALGKFERFLWAEDHLDLEQALALFKSNVIDPIEALDGFYTHLTASHLENGKVGYSNSSITIAITVAKEFLNSQGLHIYNEDIKQKFKMPKKKTVFEEGLTKELIVRLLHNLSPKMQMVVLMCLSSAMRIGELIQLRLSDIDFSTNPTSIHLRGETTKTREDRITHISAEATKSLKDYLRKKFEWSEEMRDNRYLLMDNKRDLRDPREYDRSMRSVKSTLGQSLEIAVKSVPELSMRNDNGRYRIHFHAFRAWFKTQVTMAGQSDFAEALMGHKSLKLVYFRQTQKDRLKTYLEVEPALTVSDFGKVEETIDDMKAKIRTLQEELEKVKQWQEINESFVKIEK